MKNLILFLVSLVCVLTVKSQTLQLDANAYKPGDKITVKFNALSSYDNNAWIGIVPSEVAHGSEVENDKHELSYQYIEKRTSGEMIFTAPDKIGHYDFRMHNSDNQGIEVASVSFEVSNSITVSSNFALECNMNLEKFTFSPGEQIKLHFKAPGLKSSNAWIGILPVNISHGSETENDKHEITYQYLDNKTSGTLVFTAPSTQGNYSFRMHDTDSNGVEIGNISFTVK